MRCRLKYAAPLLDTMHNIGSITIAAGGTWWAIAFAIPDTFLHLSSDWLDENNTLELIYASTWAAAAAGLSLYTYLRIEQNFAAHNTLEWLYEKGTQELASSGAWWASAYAIPNTAIKAADPAEIIYNNTADIIHASLVTLLAASIAYNNHRTTLSTSTLEDKIEQLNELGKNIFGAAGAWWAFVFAMPNVFITHVDNQQQIYTDTAELTHMALSVLMAAALIAYAYSQPTPHSPQTFKDALLPQDFLPEVGPLNKEEDKENTSSVSCPCWCFREGQTDTPRREPTPLTL